MLKAIRIQKGITQKDLAKRLGISQSYLCKLESKGLYKIKANVELIDSLARELNLCQIAVFLYFLNVNIYCPFYFKKTE